jgi:transposase-like protein
MKKRNKYDAQFKEDAVTLVENSDRTIKEIAEELGLDRSTLAYWRREKLEYKEKAFPGNGNPRDEEMARLKRELADVRMERDILKKAVGIFAKTSQPINTSL